MFNSFNAMFGGGSPQHYYNQSHEAGHSYPDQSYTHYSHQDYDQQSHQSSYHSNTVNSYNESSSYHASSSYYGNYDSGSQYDRGYGGSGSSSGGGYGGNGGNIVQVKSSTLEALQDAARAHRITKRILCYGAGNQRRDIESSGGASWARNELACKKYPSGGEAQIKRAQKFQGGNCPVFASVAASVLQPESGSTPLMRVRTPLPDGRSHEYLLLGDRRDARWGDKNTVVVDAWPTNPVATTLENAVLYDHERNVSVRLTDLPSLSRYGERESSLSRSWMKKIDKIEPMSSDKVMKEFKKAFKKEFRSQAVPEIGSQLVNHAIQQEEGGLFDVRTGTNPDIQYTDGSSAPRSF